MVKLIQMIFLGRGKIFVTQLSLGGGGGELDSYKHPLSGHFVQQLFFYNYVYKHDLFCFLMFCFFYILSLFTNEA